MGEEAVYYYPHALECVPDSYVNQEMCQKSVDKYPSSLMVISNCFKDQRYV